jgi:hypothetical protein
MFRVILSAVLILFSVSCAEPFVVFSGGKLSGEITIPPMAWSVADSTDTVQLETRLTDPYSINIWAASTGKDLYIATGPDGATWTSYIEDSPMVRLRVRQRVYLLKAISISDVAERKKVSSAYVKKYDLEEDNWVNEARIYRLDRLQVQQD